MKIARYLLAVLGAAACLWVAANAVIQSRLAMPGVSSLTRVGFLFTGLPANAPACPAEVHALYTTTGPDGQTYLTWHPPYDLAHRCAFDHEHGSDPHRYVGYPSAGMPAFGYTAAQANAPETHAGYKVYVSNDDLLGRAWMITAHQDTSTPERAIQQFHTFDWHISTRSGQPLVSIHILADYGPAVANCALDQEIHPADRGNPVQVSQQRAIVTTACAAENPYESWTAGVNVGGVFEAAPVLDIQNPISVVDPADMRAVHPTCRYRPEDERCAPPGSLGQPPWRGNRRGVIHPGQFVHNTGEEMFSTDAYGNPAEPGTAGAILQFVTARGWDSRNCCGEQVVFYLQTWSDGLFVPSPTEPAGSAEFWYR